jgi:hypothetical protein
MEKEQTIDELMPEIYTIMYGIKKSFWARKEYVFVSKCLDKTWRTLVSDTNIAPSRLLAIRIKMILLEIRSLKLTTESITILYKDISRCKSALECVFLIKALERLKKDPDSGVTTYLKFEQEKT